MNSVSPLLSRSVLSQSPARWGFLIIWLLWLCAVVGCDGFQRSVCDRQSLSTCLPGSLPDLAPAPFPTPSSERHFEWRAELARSSSQSLVGLSGKKVGMSESYKDYETAVRFYNLDLGNQDSAKRVILDRVRALSLRMIGYDIKLVSVGSNYYVLDSKSGIIMYDIYGGYPIGLLSPCRNSRDLARPFAHQQIDALAASCDNGAVVALFPASAGRVYTLDVAFRVDAMAVADWADRELGRSLIVLGGNSVRLIGQLDGRSEGKEWAAALKDQLESVLYRRKVGLGPVTAAYVADVNGDAYPEMVFAQRGSVWALSYRGADRASSGEAFTVWPERLVDLPVGETARALLLADLDGDEFPDMVIETDRFVRFYRSVAGRL